MSVLSNHLDLQTRKNMRSRRKMLGLCTWCAAPVEKDLKNRVTGAKRSMCRKCLRENADKLARIRKNRSVAGLCERCGRCPPKENRKNCSECTTRLSAQHKATRHRRFFECRARSIKNYSVGLAKFLCSLWKKQRGKCALTGARLTRYNAEVDHIVAKTKGGDGGRENLRWLLKDVNQAKRALSDEQFLLLCKQVVNYAERK